jgi:[histone H3]-trimethyl-L-lysine9/36 demethylase
VPPPEWSSKFSDYPLKLEQLNVTGPIEQNIFGKGGIYECLHIQKKSMSLREYREKQSVFDRITSGRSA